VIVLLFEAKHNSSDRRLI
jgi:hypothetical protein